MIKAEDLIKEQIERENRKYITFDKIYKLVEKKIYLASKGDNYYTWYQIPEFLVGLPVYSPKDCNSYIQSKLKKNGFNTDFYDPNFLLIKWFPKN
jgi:hypothetical protein|uniref:Uncharacterized protein n=1 Tax=viral metagenome TaxID=1070528 RepID=A0A6C0EC46_9ZZZZ